MRAPELQSVSIMCHYNNSVDSSGQSQEAFCWKVRFHYPKAIWNLSVWGVVV